MNAALQIALIPIFLAMLAWEHVKEYCGECFYMLKSVKEDIKQARRHMGTGKDK